MTIREIQDAMGHTASEEDAKLMRDILEERGITELADMGDEEFFRSLDELQKMKNDA